MATKRRLLTIELILVDQSTRQHGILQVVNEGEDLKPSWVVDVPKIRALAI
jgi:hypothetical protein